jgi:hypothetical protein
LTPLLSPSLPDSDMGAIVTAKFASYQLQDSFDHTPPPPPPATVVRRGDDERVPVLSGMTVYEDYDVRLVSAPIGRLHTFTYVCA